MNQAVTERERKSPGTLVELLITVAVPALILMKLSGDEQLGSVWALVVALAFPFIYGSWDLLSNRHVNFFAILGLVSVLLTGGIGLLELDTKYIAIKEATVPAIIGIAVWVSLYTRYSVVRKLLLNPSIFDHEKLNKALAENGQLAEFEKAIVRAGYGIVVSFAFSSSVNYILAKSIVVSPTGTEAFNQELGKLTALSIPVIVLPTMVILLGAIIYLFWKMYKLTGESVESFIELE
ncbi:MULTISPECIES: VC0807 family protein [Gammaproteobacteria]|uniref:VC0807 family protein n=1 Tax=Gammaproteobacteria TaxID=1236 RepID=UPI000DD04283|nr:MULTISPECIES: VC0807 family protein [Gammaproteobacteria]RTE85484.1 MFS transporter [Aliidiomarina sp. B3213]TCZ89452.1 MFS transporter [Lysobacter sp. N42]